MNEFHETVEPYRVDGDQSLEEVPEEVRIQAEAEAAELRAREAAGEKVGH